VAFFWVWDGIYFEEILWIYATEKMKKGTADIFLIGSFLEYCKNNRGWKMEGQ
jgi:hypothetical protein